VAHCYAELAIFSTSGRAITGNHSAHSPSSSATICTFEYYFTVTHLNAALEIQLRSALL